MMHKTEHDQHKMYVHVDKLVSCRRQTALQGGQALAKIKVKVEDELCRM